MAALHDLSAVELVAAYRKKELSPVDAAQAAHDQAAEVAVTAQHQHAKCPFHCH